MLRLWFGNVEVNQNSGKGKDFLGSCDFIKFERVTNIVGDGKENVTSPTMVGDALDPNPNWVKRWPLKRTLAWGPR